jgi:hypothetical protein
MNEHPPLSELQTMSTGETTGHETGDAATGLKDTDSARDASLVFYPISLDIEQHDDDDSDNDNNSAAAEDTGPSTPKHTKKNKQHHRTIIMDDKPLLEHAIQDCFQLAVSTHDATHTQAVWQPWEDHNHNSNKTFNNKHAPAAIPDVDWSKEQQALQSWIPRPLPLPAWAVPY